MSSSIIRVVSFCSYLTSGDVVWADNNYRALNAVRLVKGEEPTRDLTITYKGEKSTYNLQSCDEFLDNVVANVMAASIEEDFGKPVTLVPIPGSKITSVSSPKFRTLRLANSIANHLNGGCTAVPSIVFKQEMLSSRKGGPRDPYVLLDAMRLLSVPAGKVILIDDVYTTAAHFKACLWKLEDANVEVIGALAFGQATKIQSSKVFYRREEEIDCSRTESGENWWD